MKANQGSTCDFLNAASAMRLAKADTMKITLRWSIFLMSQLPYRNGDELKLKSLVRRLPQQRLTSITYSLHHLLSPWWNDMDLETIASFSCCWGPKGSQLYLLQTLQFFNFRIYISAGPWLYQKAVLNRALLREHGVNNILPLMKEITCQFNPFIPYAISLWHCCKKKSVSAR